MQKIAILGFGLNGMISSILASQAGFEVTVFEEGDLNKYKEDTRTSAITNQSLDFFKTLGLFEKLENHFSKMEYIYAFEGEKSSVLCLESDDFEGRPLGFVIHNFALKEAMLSRSKELGVKIKNTKVQSFENKQSFIALKTKDGEEDFKLVLNCAGSGFAKKDCKIPYNQTAFVFNISHTERHKNIGVESFAPQGPLAVLPLQNNNQSAVIWTLKNQTAEFLKSASKKDFLTHFQFATRRMGHIGEITSVISDIKTYPLELSFNKSQVKERTLLLGDSFNSIHPVAGSSFNMSVKDMKNLYEYLQTARKLGLDVGSSIELKNLARKNLMHHIEMNSFTHLLVMMFSNSNQILKSVRNMGINILESAPQVKHFFTKRATGL